MADNVTVTAGTGTTVAADEVSDGTLGSCKVQFVKIMDGTLDGTTKAAVGAAGLKVDPSGATSPVSVASGGVASGAIASGAIASGAYASGALSNVLAYNVGAASATSPRVTLADIGSGEYETIAASQTDQSMGATGGTGDFLLSLLIVPGTVNPGAVSIKDGGGSSITIFTGGTASVSNLVPFLVPLGLYSLSGAWKVTTGANVTAIGIGNFT